MKYTNEFTKHIPIDYIIAKSLCEYPSLYLRKTYIESKQEILHQLFCVIGNGYKLFNTTEGYILSERISDADIQYFCTNYEDKRELLKIKQQEFDYIDFSFYDKVKEVFNFIENNNTINHLYVNNENNFVIDIQEHNDLNKLSYTELKTNNFLKIKLNNFNFENLYPVYVNYSYCCFKEKYANDWHEALIE
ncbi:MAG: hypothetical protein RSC92_05685, partial [Clostridia bacterium]